MGEPFASITGVETNLPVGEAIPEIHTHTHAHKEKYIVIIF